MPLVRITPDRLDVVTPTRFIDEGLREREDLQRLLRRDISLVGDDLLVVAEEYGQFQDARRRIDLLAIDSEGTLVVIELKRTDDGGHMELQALRYAAMVSTMTREQLGETFARTHDLDRDAAEEQLRDHLGEAADEELPNTVRIILVSMDFGLEVTSTVLWLNDNYNTRIDCFRITPYRVDDVVLLDIQPIIPLPEASSFQIRQRSKGVAAAATRASGGRDFTRYDVAVAEEATKDQSKQSAIKFAIGGLARSGVPIRAIRNVALPQRWVATHPGEEETVEEAFAREYPDRPTRRLWLDLDLTDEEVSWVVPRWGGTDTEPLLTALAEVALAHGVGFQWRRAGASEAATSPGPEADVSATGA